MKSIYLLFLCTIFVACEKSPIEQKTITQENFNNPEFVGTLPNNKKVMRVWAQLKQKEHAIYFIENGEGTEITVNYPIQTGKVTINEVVVLLNGKSISTNYIK